MTLRMSICAVISLGLTVGAHWVAGQATQGPTAAARNPQPKPPLVAGASPSKARAGAEKAGPAASPPSGDASPATPPLVAGPAEAATAPPPATEALDAVPPPRVAVPAGPDAETVVAQPELPPADEPPPVLPPAAEPSPTMTAFGAADDDPPPLLDMGSGQPADPPGADAMGLDTPPDALGDAPIAASPSGVPTGLGPPPGLADEPAAPQAAPAGDDPFLAVAPAESPVDPAPDGPAADAAPVDDGLGFPSLGLPGAGAGDIDAGIEADAASTTAPADADPSGMAADPGTFNPADVAADPGLGTPGAMAPGPAAPADDPGSFATIPDDPPAAEPGPDPAPAAAPPPSGRVWADTTPDPPAAAAEVEPSPTPPDFAAPPTDSSLVASAAPGDGTGTMADTLAERMPEGPRAVELSLVVDQPPNANINLPMKVVITLRNEGRDDAFDVFVRVPLPDGLEYMKSSPPPDEQADGDRTLAWRWASLPAGETRMIDLEVKPLKAVPMDIVPRVSSVMAAKSRTAVQEPILKIDLVGPNSDQLRGSEFDFQVTVRNTGNGPAGQVNLVATLSGGLRGYDHEGKLSDATRFEQLIGPLEPGGVFGPVALSVLADGQGEQSCIIEATSPDVVPATPVSEKKITIVAPQLDVEVSGPESRPVGSMADYVVTITNKGTAAATEVLVGFFAPESGVLEEVPRDAEYYQDPKKTHHRIYWRLPRLDKGESRQFTVPIRLDRITIYPVQVAAHCQGFTSEKDVDRATKNTEVVGIPDVKIMDVARKDPVIDAGGTTEFVVRIQNIGSKEATDVYVDFFTNEWLKVVSTDPPGVSTNDKNPHHHGFAPIDRLAPGNDRTFIVTVQALKPGPAVANFDVKVFWDGLDESDAISQNNHVRIAEGQVARSPAAAPRE